MIFWIRQLQEKTRKQNKDLFIAFIDLTKALDTVNRLIVWPLIKNRDHPKIPNHTETNA